MVHQGEILAMKKEVDAFSSERNVQYLTRASIGIHSSAWKLLEMLCETRLKDPIISNIQ